MAYVYMLHFDAPLEHQQHYVGSCTDLDIRMKKHASGTGAVLTRRFYRAGITFVVAATWEHDTNLDARRAERKVKKAGSARKCPICKDGASAQKSA